MVSGYKVLRCSYLKHTQKNLRRLNYSNDSWRAAANAALSAYVGRGFTGPWTMDTLQVSSSLSGMEAEIDRDREHLLY